MHLLHRSAKRLLLNRVYRGPAEIHRCLLGEEHAQKNIINQFTRHFSVLADDHIHETSLSKERKCKRENGALELAGGATILNSVTHADDCASIQVDDSVSMCALASQKKKGNSCDSITSEPAGTSCLLKQKEGNKHFDGSTSEFAIFNPCKASCKDINKVKHFDSSMREHELEMVQTIKFPSKAKQGNIVDDSTSEFFARDIKSMSRKHTGERLKLSIDNAETSLQREDTGMIRIKDASDVCVSDTKTSFSKNAEERTSGDLCSFLKGVGASEKLEFFTKEHGPVSRPCERVYCAVQKKIDKNKKKKKKKTKNKKKKESSNTNRQFGPEELEHLSLTSHPFRIAAAGQALRKEKMKTHGESFKDDHTRLPNYSLMQSNACQKSLEYIDSVPRDVLKLNNKEKRESVDAIFADTRPLLLAEKEHTHLNDLSLNEVIDKASSSPNHLVKKWQRAHSTMKPHLCKENEAENEASGYLLENRRKMIAYNEMKDGTFLDPSSNFWEQLRTIAPVETIECGVERAKCDLAGVRKVHYPLRNYRELYIILDLNGVLIKRWDKNPSLPGVSKLNKKWIQLRPGCIEFLQKAFSSFRVGIWSTMTQTNVLSMCKFLEQQADQSLPFFMLWSKDSCYQHRGVQRPNKANVVADFKPLSRVWGYFKPYLGFHNTILVDDSPYKACMNSPYNCIFPDAFEGYTDDKYLNDVLWPYLEKMRMSHNIQAYIANNPFGQPPVVVGHELYHHVHQVMDVFDYCASPLTRAT